MHLNIRPQVEKQIEERLKSGRYASAEELVHAALEQFMADDLGPGELDALLAAGEADVRAGRLVKGEDVFRRLRERSEARRRGQRIYSY